MDESGKIAMVQIGYARVSTLEQEMVLQLDAASHCRLRPDFRGSCIRSKDGPTWAN
jgi:hypothetical protein